MKVGQLLILSLVALAVTAQPAQKQPQPIPMPPAIAAPVDQPYAGPLQLDVDLTDFTHRVAHVREQIPVPNNARELVLQYPQWIPGAHSPVGPISRVAGIMTSVDGTRVQWIRDQIQVYAFHVPLRAGARSVSVQFDYLSPIKAAEGRIEWSDAIVDLPWNAVAMYPAGFFSRDIPFDVTLKLPPDGSTRPLWKRRRTKARQ